MVIPTSIMATAYLKLTLVGLSIAHKQLSNSRYPSIFVHMIATHTAKRIPLFQRSWWKHTVIIFYPDLAKGWPYLVSLLLNLDKRVLCSCTCTQNLKK